MSINDSSNRSMRIVIPTQLTSPSSHARIIKAKVPLAEKFGYVTVLRTLTSGRATSTMEFLRYEPVPSEIAKKIIEEKQKAKESGE